MDTEARETVDCLRAKATRARTRARTARVSAIGRLFRHGDRAARPVVRRRGGAAGVPDRRVQSGGERRYPIPAADSVNIDHAAQLIVARFQGQVFVFSLSCPHQNNAVKWLPRIIASSARSMIPSTSPTACTRPAARPGTWIGT